MGWKRYLPVWFLNCVSIAIWNLIHSQVIPPAGASTSKDGALGVHFWTKLHFNSVTFSDSDTHSSLYCDICTVCVTYTEYSRHSLTVISVSCFEYNLNSVPFLCEGISVSTELIIWIIWIILNVNNKRGTFAFEFGVAVENKRNWWNWTHSSLAPKTGSSQCAAQNVPTNRTKWAKSIPATSDWVLKAALFSCILTPRGSATSFKHNTDLITLYSYYGEYVSKTLSIYTTMEQIVFAPLFRFLKILVQHWVRI